jgi:hypothetical protein
MPLQFSKLARFLEKNKMVITTCYVVRDYCKYIRAFSIDTGISFLISVNRDYHCKVEEGNNNVCTLEKIKFSARGQSVIERFLSYPSDKEVKSVYEIQLSHNIEPKDKTSDKKEKQEDEEEKTKTSSGNDSDDNIASGYDKEEEKEEEEKVQSETEEEKLHQQYKKKILLEDVDKSAENKLKECVRQVKRLSFGLEDLDYSICIVDEKFFVTVDSAEAPIETYFCKTQKTDGKRLFFISISLENFYEYKQKALQDIQEIRQAIFSILDKNSDYNIQKLHRMFSQLDSMGETVQQIFDAKTRLASYIQKFQKLLLDVLSSEKENTKQMALLLQEESSGRLNEVSFVYKKQDLEDKLSRIVQIKQQILKNITTVINENDNLYLKSDRCDFENIILLDAIVRNLKENEREISLIKS